MTEKDALFARNKYMFIYILILCIYKYIYIYFYIYIYIYIYSYISYTSLTHVIVRCRSGRPGIFSQIGHPIEARASLHDPPLIPSERYFCNVTEVSESPPPCRAFPLRGERGSSPLERLIAVEILAGVSRSVLSQPARCHQMLQLFHRYIYVWRF